MAPSVKVAPTTPEKLSTYISYYVQPTKGNYKHDAVIIHSYSHDSFEEFPRVQILNKIDSWSESFLVITRLR